jgi:GTP cyclohydrolase I
VSVFSPGVGDLVEIMCGNGWQLARVIAVPGRDEHKYMVEYDENIEGREPRLAVDYRAITHMREPALPDGFGEHEVTPVLSRTRSRTVTGDEPVSPEQAVRHAAKLLDHIAADVDSETPARFVRALGEFTQGYKEEDFAAILKTFPRGNADTGIVVVRDMPFASLCEHHVLPFTGTAAVAYLPSDRIVGLSKIPRLLRAVTRRLQVQERIGAMVADALVKHVGARGAMVVIRSQHTCMALRGIECPGSMVTSTVRGVFADEHDARAEALALMGD